jgi:ABC-type amino acid transport system permease subunit
VVIVVAWQASALLGWIADTIMPSPYAVGAAAWRLTLSGELPQNLLVSALRAFGGLVVGGGVGLALGLLNGLSGLSFSVTDTSVQMIRNVPHLALIPLVIVWFGIDEGPSSLSLRLASSSRSTSTRCMASAASTRNSSKWRAVMAFAVGRCSGALSGPARFPRSLLAFASRSG